MSDDGADARRVAPPEPLAELLSMWRQMIAKALAKGPIEYDEIGHASRWTAVEMCADELERAHSCRPGHPATAGTAEGVRSVQLLRLDFQDGHLRVLRART
jgi:hypothetical protein